MWYNEIDMPQHTPYERAKKAKLGTGARFATLKKTIAAKGKVKNPAAVAASIGMKKFGKKKMLKMAMKSRMGK